MKSSACTAPTWSTMANIPLSHLEAWFVTGSQHLYGEDVLQQVADHSRQIAGALNDAASIPVSVVFKPVVTTPDAIRALCLEANASASCIGLIAWMHTFSPAKMWIGGAQHPAEAAGASAHAVQS